MIIVAQKPTAMPSDLVADDEVPTGDLPEKPVSRFVRRASGEIMSVLGPAYVKHYEWITADLDDRVTSPIKWAILVRKIIVSILRLCAYTRDILTNTRTPTPTPGPSSFRHSNPSGSSNGGY